jgi:hypothetical protein
MTRETLATLSAQRAALERMVRLGALDGSTGPYYDEMLVRVTEDRVETPAGRTDSSMAAYCTVQQDAFDAVSLAIDQPATAIFDIDAALGWLDWLDADAVDVALLGDPATGFGGTLELRTDDATVQLASEHGTERLGDVTMELPTRFDDDDRFRLEDGSYAPTWIETTAATLSRVATAVDLADTVEGYPVRVADGDLVLDVGSELSRAHATGPLDGEVSGDDVHNRYGPEYAALADALTGDLTLQTGPDEPLVVVQDHDQFTLRYVLLPRTW